MEFWHPAIGKEEQGRIPVADINKIWVFGCFIQQSKSSQSPSCASSDKVSCTIWEGSEAKKADLSVLDISALIIAKVERARENSDYLYLGKGNIYSRVDKLLSST